MTTREIDLNATLEAIDGMNYTLDGVAGKIRVYVNRFGSLDLKHVASKAGRRSEAYRETRRQLGDDYETCWEITPDDVWAKAERQGRFRYC